MIHATMVLSRMIGAEEYIEESRLVLIVSHPASVEHYIVVALTMAMRLEETSSSYGR